MKLLLFLEHREYLRMHRKTSLERKGKVRTYAFKMKVENEFSPIFLERGNAAVFNIASLVIILYEQDIIVCWHQFSLTACLALEWQELKARKRTRQYIYYNGLQQAD